MQHRSKIGNEWGTLSRNYLQQVDARNHMDKMNSTPRQFRRKKHEEGLQGDVGKLRQELWRLAVFDIRREPLLQSIHHREEDPTVGDKTEDAKQSISKVLLQLPFLHVDQSQLAKIVEVTISEEVKRGTILLRSGVGGDRFYIVEEGAFEVIPTGEVIKAGGSFGEHALISTNMPSSRTVKAATDSKIWTLHRSLVRKIMVNTSAKKHEEYLDFLRGVKTFSTLREQELRRLALALEAEPHKDADVIIKQGEVGDTFYIVRRGQVDVTMLDDEGNAGKVATYSVGEYFGERALTSNEKRAATIVAVGNVELLTLKKDAFQLLIPRSFMQESFSQRAAGYVLARQALQSKEDDEDEQPAPKHEHGHGQVSSEQLGTSTLPHEAENNGQLEQDELAAYEQLKLSDLVVIGTLGRGSFGHVQLVSEVKSTPGRTVLHALKTVNKALLYELKQVDHLRSETEVMKQLRRHPFLTRLHSVLNEEHSIHLLIEPVAGGDLKGLLREREYFDTDTARFVAACVLQAFEFMHSKGIVFRDLKPENVLLERSGYAKLTDFGFAKQLSGLGARTYTLCGTPDYLAPEVVIGQGHDLSVDFWTVGVLIYEMLVGEPPFWDENPMGIYQNIVRGHILFPADLKPDEVDIIRNLVCKLPGRLGVVAGGYNQIYTHPFFASVDWLALGRKQVKAPLVLVREVENEVDLKFSQDLLGDDDRWRDWNPAIDLDQGESDPFVNF